MRGLRRDRRGRGSLRPRPARVAALALIAGAIVSVHACGDEGTEPAIQVPGQLAVALVSPHGDEGAVVLETLDGGIAAAAVEGGEAYVGGSPLRTRVVALLSAPGEIRITLDVDDIERPPELNIVEVADGSNALRPDLAGYSLAVEVLGPTAVLGSVSP